jgi:hypothetical protein
MSPWCSSCRDASGSEGLQSGDDIFNRGLGLAWGGLWAVEAGYCTPGLRREGPALHRVRAGPSGGWRAAHIQYGARDLGGHGLLAEPPTGQSLLPPTNGGAALPWGQGPAAAAREKKKQDWQERAWALADRQMLQPWVVRVPRAGGRAGGQTGGLEFGKPMGAGSRRAGWAPDHATPSWLGGQAGAPAGGVPLAAAARGGRRGCADAFSAAPPWPPRR